MKRRVQSLQALRGIAFLMIFCSHCTFIESFSASWGGIGVSVFVVLSGFVVTFGKDLKDMQCRLKAVPYTIKRIKKIFPLHFITLFIRLVLEHVHGMEIPFILVLLNITMMKSFIPVQKIYYSWGGVTWYLTLIWLFALLTPFLIRILKTFQKYCLHMFLLVLLFRISWIYIWHTSDISQWWNYINPFFRVTDYFTGMILGANICSLKKLLTEKRGCYVLLSCTVWIMLISYTILLSVTSLP